MSTTFAPARTSASRPCTSGHHGAPAFSNIRRVNPCTADASAGMLSFGMIRVSRRTAPVVSITAKSITSADDPSPVVSVSSTNTSSRSTSGNHAGRPPPLFRTELPPPTCRRSPRATRTPHQSANPITRTKSSSSPICSPGALVTMSTVSPLGATIHLAWRRWIDSSLAHTRDHRPHPPASIVSSSVDGLGLGLSGRHAGTSSPTGTWSRPTTTPSRSDNSISSRRMRATMNRNVIAAPSGSAAH